MVTLRLAYTKVMCYHNTCGRCSERLHLKSVTTTTSQSVTITPDMLPQHPSFNSVVSVLTVWPVYTTQDDSIQK